MRRSRIPFPARASHSRRESEKKMHRWWYREQPSNTHQQPVKRRESCLEFLPRPGSFPCSGAMGTMESSIDADEVVAILVNGDKGVPLALENSVGSATILQCSQTLRRFRGMLIIRSHLLLVTASPHRVIRVSGVCRVWASVLSRKQGRVLPRFRHRRTLRSTGAGSPSHLLSWTKRVPARVTHRRQERGCLI